MQYISTTMVDGGNDESSVTVTWTGPTSGRNMQALRAFMFHELTKGGRLRTQHDVIWYGPEDQELPLTDEEVRLPVTILTRPHWLEALVAGDVTTRLGFEVDLQTNTLAVWPE